MKLNLTEKLLSICENSMEGFSINNSTEKQRIQVEEELIKHFEFDKIVWMNLPSGLAEDGKTPIVVKSLKLSDNNDKHTGKVGYIYTISFTPLLYDPSKMHMPVKDGCVFAPTIYDPQTFEPKQSITLTWSPDFPQDIDTPARTLEDDKQMIRDMLEKVLNTPEEYRPLGYVGCLVRFATI